jgi:hypothetical protein
MPRLGAPVVVRTACFAALVFAITASAQLPADFRPQLAVLHSEDAGSALPRERAVLALWYAAEEMGVLAKDLPRVVVIRSCPASAEVVANPATLKLIRSGAAHGEVVVYPIPDMKERLYELWIIGDDPEFSLAEGMVKILAVHRDLNVNTQEDHVWRISRRLSDTTSAGALLPKRPSLSHKCHHC